MCCNTMIDSGHNVNVCFVVFVLLFIYFIFFYFCAISPKVFIMVTSDMVYKCIYTYKMCLLFNRMFNTQTTLDDIAGASIIIYGDGCFVCLCLMRDLL